MSTSVPRTDQLLSAYLDGELNAEEVREVEAWLAEDATARQLLDELQAVCSAVQSLPVELLEGDLSAEVLQRLPSATDRNKGPASTDGAALPERRGFRLSARGFRWSAAAIAAAIMVAVLQQPSDPNVANVAKQEAGGEQAPAAAAPRGTGEMRAAAPDVTIAMDETESTADGPAPEGLSTMSAANDAARSVESFPSPAASLPPAPAGAELAGTDDAARPAPANSEVAPSQRAADTTDARQGEEAEQERYLIVWVDMPEAALEQRAIDKLLTDNGIAFDSQREGWAAAGEPLREQIASRAGPTISVPLTSTGPQRTRDVRDARTFEQEAAPPEAAQPQQDLATQQPREPGQAGDAILVDATLEQVAQTLAAMEEDAANFSNITVEPVAQPLQRGDERRALAREESGGKRNRARRIASSEPLANAAPPSESPRAGTAESNRLNIVQPLSDRQGETSRALVPAGRQGREQSSRASQVAEALTENTTGAPSYQYSTKSLAQKSLAAEQRLQVLFVLRPHAAPAEAAEAPADVQPATAPASRPNG